MAETKAQRRPTTASKPRTAGKPRATRVRQAPETRSAGEHKTATARATELSDDVLRALESGQHAVIEATTKFIDTVDQALPLPGNGTSRRQKVIDAAMEMPARLVHTLYDFLRTVVRGAGKTLTRSADDKK